MQSSRDGPEISGKWRVTARGVHGLGLSSPQVRNDLVCGRGFSLGNPLGRRLRCLVEPVNPSYHPFLTGWHNVENLDGRQAEWAKYYVTVQSWWDALETSHILKKPSSTVLSYGAKFADLHVGHDSQDTIRVRERTLPMKLAMYEFVVVAFMRCLMEACDVVTGRLCVDTLLRIAAPEVD